GGAGVLGGERRPEGGELLLRALRGGVGAARAAGPDAERDQRDDRPGAVEAAGGVHGGGVELRGGAVERAGGGWIGGGDGGEVRHHAAGEHQGLRGEQRGERQGDLGEGHRGGGVPGRAGEGGGGGGAGHPAADGEGGGADAGGGEEGGAG